MTTPSPLPIDSLLPDLRQALARHSSAVLQAAPGAGKTTRVPLALLNEPWLAGRKIVMLEPRRLAARAAARFMAAQRGEAVGETVGFRVRLESKVSARTRIEVVTEGILTRRLQHDPALEGVGLVIFDEFHERSLDGDLGLALTLDSREGLRPDLKILVMSATLDGAAVASLLGDAPLLTCEGRAHAVGTRYAARDPRRRLEDDVASLVRRALREEPGSALVFLPGEREIRRAAALLAEGGLPPDTTVHPLYGALPAAEQDRAIAPAPPGGRKIVLATTIAETSLTIEGIRIVVDSGLKRAPRFDPRTGLTRLETVRVSQASADQRRGRAGRLEPGACYRLWTEAEMRGFAPFDKPEILAADLAPLALDLAAWGVSDPLALRWLDRPPKAAYDQGLALLKELGALDDAGRIAALGRQMAALPLHPRLAHMLVKAKAAGQGALACDLAALLSERDILRQAQDADVRTRLEIIAARRPGRGDAAVNMGALARVRETAADLRRQLKPADKAASGFTGAGPLLALAYPDRVAQQRGGRGRFRLAGGGGAYLAETDPLAAAEFLVAAELEGDAREGRIYLAAPLTAADIEAEFADRIADTAVIEWDARAEAVGARRQRRFGAIVLEDRPIDKADPAAVLAALVAGLRQMGPACLPWTEEIGSWRQRIEFLRWARPEEGWPDLSDSRLMETLEDWLAPYLTGMSRRSHLAGLDLAGALRALLSWPLQRRLDELAPTHVEVPSGARIAIDYGPAEGPVLAVQLQHLFGLLDTPRVAEGRVPVTLHLLSPARRPIAVTKDLKSFWANVYPEVRGEMRGRYPKHRWPEDPIAAAPGLRRRR
jgi:ATP-dependent helicase HrpB